MDISRADIVMSLSGRDKEQLFYVLELQDEYVLYADGKSRRIEHPKRKKKKHMYWKSWERSAKWKSCRNV